MSGSRSEGETDYHPIYVPTLSQPDPTDKTNLNPKTTQSRAEVLRCWGGGLGMSAEVPSRQSWDMLERLCV